MGEIGGCWGRWVSAKIQVKPFTDRMVEYGAPGGSRTRIASGAIGVSCPLDDGGFVTILMCGCRTAPMVPWLIDYDRFLAYQVRRISVFR